jgi:hypothetical protein
MMTQDASQWPQTVDEAVQVLLASLSDAEQQRIRDTEWDDLYRFHHDLGTTIRNTFGLWRGNQALLDSCDAVHPDTAAMVIIRALWTKLRQDTQT